MSFSLFLLVCLLKAVSMPPSCTWTSTGNKKERRVGSVEIPRLLYSEAACLPTSFAVCWWMTALKNMVSLTSPSLGLIFASWITSRWADCETRGSDDRDMMWSHTPERVLHWKRKKKVMVNTRCSNIQITTYYDSGEFYFLVHVCANISAGPSEPSAGSRSGLQAIEN